MSHSLRKRIKRSIYRRLLKGVYRDLFEEECARRVIVSVTRALGQFEDGAQHVSLAISGLNSESGTILGEVVHALRRFAKPEHTLLLAGERRSACSAYGKASGIPVTQILTAGLHEDMDYRWNYEELPPAIPAVDIIASHAMIEHLVDPYRHIRDCYGLLKPGGVLVVHTVMPGFQYHRFPVDCFRFYPDWFEEVASRLEARVAARYLSVQGHIVYCLARPQQTGESAP
ncbi:MAG: methyltransferase domain-containing protein [Rhodocyclales bacterium]|nr:methyltransferase domain-containing protein [Rhodocyclales bacterium]